MEYSDKVIDHYTNPRNVGKIEDASGIGEVGNPVCGDIMKMFIKVENNIITDVKFKTFGCGAAIATSSISTELIKGKSIEEALELKNSDVVKISKLIVIICVSSILLKNYIEIVNRLREMSPLWEKFIEEEDK